MSFRPPVSELSVDFHKLFSRLFRFMSLLVMGIMCLSYSPVFQIPICQIESSHSAVSVLVLPLSSVLKYSVSNWKEVVDDVIMWPDSSVTVCVDEVMRTRGRWCMLPMPFISKPMQLTLRLETVSHCIVHDIVTCRASVTGCMDVLSVYITSKKSLNTSKIQGWTYEYAIILKPGVSVRRELMSWLNSPVTA